MKYVTFSVSTTYTVEIDLPDDTPDEDVIDDAWEIVGNADISAGDLENPDWEVLCVDEG